MLSKLPRSLALLRSLFVYVAEGGIEINERALAYAKSLLADYREPKLDVAIDEALLDYIARREREIPAAEALNNSY